MAANGIKQHGRANNLRRHQQYNFRFENRTTIPTEHSEGLAYYDSNAGNKHLYYCVDDTVPVYARVLRGDTAETVTGLWTFYPSSGDKPFALHADAIGKVDYLNADRVDNYHASQSVVANTLAARNADGTISAADPVENSHLVTLGYVTNLIDNYDPKDPCEAATTGDIDISSAPATIDGYAPTVGERIFVWQQVDASENGIRIWNGAGNPMPRSSDANEDDEVTSGMQTFIRGGSTHAGGIFMLKTPDPIELDVDDLEFVQVGGNTLYSDGRGLTKSGNTFHAIQSTSYSVGDIVFADSASTLTFLTAAETGNVLKAGGLTTAPLWGKVDLTTDIAGVLGVDKGGSGTDQQFTAGSVIFAGASGIYKEDNTGLFFDGAADRLCIGGNNPTEKLSIILGDISLTTGYGIHAKNGGNENGIFFNASTAGSSSNFVRLYTDGSERLRVDYLGNLGLGSNDPGTDGPAIAQRLVVKGNGSTGITVTSPDANNATYNFGSVTDNDYAFFQGYYNAGAPFVRGSIKGSEVWRFASGGITLTGDLVFGDGAVRSITGPTGDDLKVIAGPDHALEGIKWYVDGGTTPGMVLLKSDNATGKVGIGGGIVPEELLHLYTNVAEDIKLRMNSDSTGSAYLELDRQTTAGKVGIILQDSNVTQWTLGDLNENNSFVFDSASVSDALVILQDGKVGIGTSAPTANLHVISTSNPTIKVGGGVSDGTTGGTSTVAWWANNGSVGNVFFATYYKDASNDRLTFIDGGANNVLTLENGGNVGIGTVSPNEQLEITENFRLPATTATTGIIYRDGTEFIHSFQHPTGDTAVPIGRNTFVGQGAANLTLGSTATSTSHGSFNNAFGFQSLGSLTTGRSNNAFGHRTGLNITTGYGNQLFGDSAGYDLVDGLHNVLIGDSAGVNLTSGSYNTAIGTYTLDAVTTTQGAIGIGYAALSNLTSGNYTIAIGHLAGGANTGATGLLSSNYGIYLGYDIRPTEGGANEIIIGKGVSGNGSNTVTIGDSTITKTFLRGNLGLGTTDIESWSSGYTALQFYGSAIMANKGADDIYLMSNAYFDGAWKYRITGPSAMLFSDVGIWQFKTATSGTIDTALSWTTALTINNDGTLTAGVLNTGTGDSILTQESGVIKKRTIDSRAWSGGGLVDGSGATQSLAFWSDSNTLSSYSSLQVNGSGQLLGGFGAAFTTGTLDWNDSSNARPGNGYSLLQGTATNGPSSDHAPATHYFHPFSFEYNTKNASGNMTQFAIPYNGVHMLFRYRYSGTWSVWHKIWNSGNDGAESGLDADLLDGQQGGYYTTATNIGGLGANRVVVTEGTGKLSSDSALVWDGNGLGIGTSVSALLTLAGGTTTKAPLKFTAGPLLSTEQVGAVEFSNETEPTLYFTRKAGARKRIVLAHEEDIGDGTNSTFTITHDLGAKPVSVVGTFNATGETFEPDWDIIDDDTISVTYLEVLSENEVSIRVAA